MAILAMLTDSLGDFKQAIKYHNQHLSIAKEIGDKAGEGGAYGNLGNAYRSLGDFKQAIKYHNQRLSIAKEIGDKAEKDALMAILAMLTIVWVILNKR